MTVIEANYLFRLAVRLYQKVEQPPRAPARLDIGAAALMGAVVIVVTLMIDPVGDKLRDVAREASDVSAYISTVLPEDR